MWRLCTKYIFQTVFLCSSAFPQQTSFGPGIVELRLFLQRVALHFLHAYGQRGFLLYFGALKHSCPWESSRQDGWWTCGTTLAGM